MKPGLLLIAFLLLAFLGSQATTITSAGSGAWGSALTWSPAQVPVAGDLVTVASGHTITLDGTGTNGTTPACSTLTVAGTLQWSSTSGFSAVTLTVSNTLSISAGPATFKIASGGTGSYAHSLKVGGNITFADNGSILNFATVGNTTVATTITGNCTISTSGTGGSGGFCNLNDLQINPSSTTTIARTFTVKGNLQIGDGVSSGAILQFRNNSITLVSLSVEGNVTIPATGGTFRSASATGSTVTQILTVNGNISINGNSPATTFNLSTFTGQTSVTVNTTITGTSTISGNGTAIFNELTVNNGFTCSLAIASITCTKLTIGTGTSGVLQFTSSGSQACSLAIGSGGLNVAAGGKFIVASGGSLNAAHSISVNAGNISVSGSNASTGMDLTTVGTTSVNFTIGSTSAITFSGTNTATCKFNNLTVADGAIVTINRSFNCNNLNLGGGTSGTLQYGSASTGVAVSTITVSGNINMSSGSLFKIASGGTGSYAHGLSVGGNILFGGSTGSINFTTVNSTTVGTTITGASSSITGSTITPIFHTLNIANGAVFTLGSSITCNSLLTVGGGTSGVLQFNSTAGSGALAVNANNGLTVAAGGKLIIEPSGTLSATHSLNITGNLSVSGSNAASGLDLSTVGGTSMNTTINGGASNITFSSTSAASCVFNNLTIANTVTTLARNATINGDLLINSGSILDLSTFSLNGIAGKKLTLAGTAALKLGGNTGGQTGSNFPSGFTLFGDGVSSTSSFASTSTVEYNGSSAQSPQTIYEAPVYGNLVLSSLSGNANKIPGSSLNITGDFTIGANTTFDAGTLSHSIGGSWLNNGTFNAVSSTIAFNSSASGKTIGGSATTTFNNLILNKTDNTKTITVSSDMNVTNQSIFTSGKLILNSGTITLNQSGQITIASNAIMVVNSPAVLSIINADLIINGGLFLNGGTLNVGTIGNNAFEVNGNTSATILNVQGGAFNIAGRFRNSASGSATVLIADGTLTTCTGSLNDASRAAFEMDGNAVFNHSGGTIVVQNKNIGIGGDVVITNGGGVKSFNGGSYCQA